MTRRHFLALEAAAQTQPLPWLVESLAEAVSEVVAEGKDADRDPAVIALSGFVAFRTHVDIISGPTFGMVLGACQDAIISRNLQ